MASTRTEAEQRRSDAEREARRLSALREVRQYPDPALRLRAHELTVFDDVLKALVERMVRVMQTAGGVGLAAPQLGVLQRVLVYQAGEGQAVLALINPRLVAISQEQERESEGCLSLAAAAISVSVERPVAVTVEALSLAEGELRLELEGLEARVVQHELDHLDGVLIIDRTTPAERREALAQLRPRPLLGPGS